MILFMFASLITVIHLFNSIDVVLFDFESVFSCELSIFINYFLHKIIPFTNTSSVPMASLYYTCQISK